MVVTKEGLEPDLMACPCLSSQVNDLRLLRLILIELMQVPILCLRVIWVASFPYWLLLGGGYAHFRIRATILSGEVPFLMMLYEPPLEIDIVGDEMAILRQYDEEHIFLAH